MKQNYNQAITRRKLLSKLQNSSENPAKTFSIINSEARAPKTVNNDKKSSSKDISQGKEIMQRLRRVQRIVLTGMRRCCCVVQKRKTFKRIYILILVLWAQRDLVPTPLTTGNTLLPSYKQTLSYRTLSACSMRRIPVLESQRLSQCLVSEWFWLAAIEFLNLGLHKRLGSEGTG